MPSFESCILAPPPGFVAGCRALNSKSKTQLGFGEAVHSGIDIVKTNCISSLDYTRREAQPLNALGVVTYLTMSWFLSTPKPSEKDVATFLDLNSALSRDVIEAFVTTYNDVNQAHQLASAPSSVKLGKIQKLSWKVGVTISSSKCADINAPYVQISLLLREAGNHLSCHQIELSYDDFLKITADFTNVFTKLDEL
jgi:hypothetical protein